MGEIVNLSGNKIGGGQVVTNHTLYKWHEEIQGWKPAFKEFSKGKIKQFYKDNGIRIDSVLRELNDLIAIHFEINNPDRKSGDPVQLKIDETTKQGILKEGFTKEDYGEAYKNFMERENRMIL